MVNEALSLFHLTCTKDAKLIQRQRDMDMKSSWDLFKVMRHDDVKTFKHITTPPFPCRLPMPRHVLVAQSSSNDIPEVRKRGCWGNVSDAGASAGATKCNLVQAGEGKNYAPHCATCFDCIVFCVWENELLLLLLLQPRAPSACAMQEDKYTFGFGTDDVTKATTIFQLTYKVFSMRTIF